MNSALLSLRSTASPVFTASLAFILSLVFIASFTATTALAKETEKAKPVIKDGETQVVKAFEDSDYWVRHDLWVETEFDSDGNGKLDRVHVSVTRPGQTQTEGLKVPVVYNSSPYFAGTNDSGDEFFWNPRQELGDEPPKRPNMPRFDRKGRRPIISKRHVKDWVPRGFAVVHSSSPGTGLSQGCPTVGGKNESLAPKAVIDWLCGRGKGYTSPDGNVSVVADWSTGKVGMTGTSYNGTLPLAAATTGVEGLEAIIPVAPNTSYYHYYRSNGLVRHPGGFLGEDIDVLYEFIHSGNPEHYDYCDCEVRDKEMMESIDRKTGDYNDFWAGRDYLNQLDDLKAAVLMAHGFNDWNVVPEHSYRISAALKKKGVPVQIYYHQGGHGGPPPMKMMNRWFTHYLHGEDNGVEKDPKSWIVREGDKQDKPTPYPDYPHPDAEEVLFHLKAGAPGIGRLVSGEESAEEQPTVTRRSRRSQRNRATMMQVPAKETLVDNYSFSGSSLAQAEWTEHRLLYTTPILTAPLHLSGVPQITVRMASDRPAVNLSVWMVSLPWNTKPKAKITDNIITRGWADPQNHESIRDGKPLEPGKFYDVTFDLQPDDQIIPAGQQIGLMIFSSDRDFTLHPKPGTKLTVDLNGTSLKLPIVGGSKAFAKSLEPAAEKDKAAEKKD